MRLNFILEKAKKESSKPLELKTKTVPPSGKKNLKKRKHRIRSESAGIHSEVCADKPYCSTLQLDSKICDAVSQVQNDCPKSCQKCNLCKDDSICPLISNVKMVCKSRPILQELCPRTCKNCHVQPKVIGELDIRLVIVMSSGIQTEQ